METKPSSNLYTYFCEQIKDERISQPHRFTSIVFIYLAKMNDSRTITTIVSTHRIVIIT